MQVKGRPINLKKSRRLGDSDAKIIGSMRNMITREEIKGKREERKKKISLAPAARFIGYFSRKGAKDTKDAKGRKKNSFLYTRKKHIKCKKFLVYKKKTSKT